MSSAIARRTPVLVLVLALAAAACTTSRPTPSSEPSTARQPAQSSEASSEPSDRSTPMNLRLTIDGHQVDAILNDSVAARDLTELLPLALDMEDFHQTERIAYPPRKLDTTGAPAASNPKAGDLAYYAPWGNLAFFYRDGDHSPNLVILGRLTDPDDIDRLATAERIRIEASA
ncbi:cyclophilin-like fold protein [Streptomyces sp. NPDC052610]|uniref:cyclophilin-like fold protein n=1 Tax=Streptomyces sp. NPDC052610 TaxID=3154952 RepID=UPI00341BB0BD